VSGGYKCDCPRPAGQPSQIKVGQGKGVPCRNILVLAAAVYVVITCRDAEYGVVLLAEGMHERRGYDVKIATERRFF
jgi:hypothetical protein